MPGRKSKEFLSTKPSQIRNRLRRKKGNYEEDLAMYAEHHPTFKPLSEWDLEELARGKPRNKNGGWSGRAPAWITPAVMEEAKRRLVSKTYEGISLHIDTALKVIHQLMTSEEVDDRGKPIVDARTKLAAATFILEHTVGKPRAQIDLNDGAGQQRKAIAAAIIEDDGLPQGHLGDWVEGEIVDDDDAEEMVEADDDE